ncbi:MAG: SDR family oxidoreductase [Pseudomonadota bacterium]
MRLGLRGKKAIITGSTRGIGRCIAETMAKEGADVAICSRDPEEVEEVVAEMRRNHDSRIIGGGVNVRDKEKYEQWLVDIADELGGCDVFVPNVSAGGGFDSEKNWWKNFEIDVLHTVRGCDALMDHLKEGEGGSIVIIGTTNAVEQFAAPMAYNAMKAALITYSKQLGLFVGHEGVRVNTVSPGPVYFEGGAWEMIKGTQEKFYNSIIRKIPRGEMGSPQEIANVVTFVASPAASYMNGANVIVDGGFTKRVQL